VNFASVETKRLVSLGLFINQRCLSLERIITSLKPTVNPTIIWEYRNKTGTKWIPFDFFITTQMNNISNGLEPREDKGVVSHHYLFHPNNPAAEGKWIEMKDITKGHQADISRSSHRVLFEKMTMVDMFEGRNVDSEWRGDRKVRRRVLTPAQARNDPATKIVYKVVQFYGEYE
jgi:hypothetical protein